MSAIQLSLPRVQTWWMHAKGKKLKPEVDYARMKSCEYTVIQLHPVHTSANKARGLQQPIVTTTRTFFPLYPSPSRSDFQSWGKKECSHVSAV